MKVKRENTVRYAVAGLGYISQIAVLPAFAHAQNSQLVALVSGDAKKREDLGRKYDVPTYGYEELEKAIADGQIEALYQSTREGRPIPVERVFKPRKPDGSQEMKRTPLTGKPDLINVQTPHS